MGRAVIVAGCTILALSACKKKGQNKEAEKPTPARKSPAAPSLADAMIKKAGKAVGCPSKTTPHRVWCIAADGWKSGTAAPLLGTGPTRTYCGLVLVVAEDRPVDFNTTRLAALVVRGEGPKRFGKIISITPDNPKESKMMAEAVFNLAKVFKGFWSTAPIPLPLMSFLAGMAAKANFPMTKGSKGWKVAGKLPGEVRKVGPFWVSVETDTKGRKGIFLGVFTDRVKAKPVAK